MKKSIKKFFYGGEFVEIIDSTTENPQALRMIQLLVERGKNKSHVVLSHPKIGLIFAFCGEVSTLTRNKDYFQKFESLTELIKTELHIRYMRSNMRMPIESSSRIGSPMIGGVHVFGNDISRYHFDRQRRNLWSSLRPRTTEKHIGLEVELISPLKQRRFIELLEKSSLKSFVSLCEDCSIEPECEGECDCNYDDEIGEHEDSCSVFSRDFAIEMRLLFKERELSNVMILLDDFLKKSQSYVNRSCGLHVHLDMRFRDVHECYSRLFNKLDVIISKVSRERLDNRYCKKNTRSEFDDHESLDDRYYMINTRSYDEHSTLEIRVHQGTTNVETIQSWVKFLIDAIQTNVNENPKAFIA
jgi:predicted transposase YbfD/YdcC